MPVNSGHDFGVGEANVAHFAQLTPEEARLQSNQRKAKLQNEGCGVHAWCSAEFSYGDNYVMMWSELLRDALSFSVSFFLSFFFFLCSGIMVVSLSQ